MKSNKRLKKNFDALIFIDTNIYLDFYRSREKSFEASMIQHIDDNHDKIICSDQVYMEFKKNRQKIILESLRRVIAPDWSGFAVPAFMFDAVQVKMIQKKKDEIKDQVNKLKDRVKEVLKNPINKDQVYQCFQRILKDKTSYYLGRDNKLRHQIRNLARKRFCLGYPPRKDKDTSIGDAINWEWIIQCAVKSGKNIIIVSRDSDYGIVYESETILNDWLKHEFQERVSQKRKIILTDRLSNAFKLTNVVISKEEEKQEEKMISDIKEDLFGVSVAPQILVEGDSDIERWKKIDEAFQSIKIQANKQR
jgi:hypothetical protein